MFAYFMQLRVTMKIAGFLIVACYLDIRWNQWASLIFLTKDVYCNETSEISSNRGHTLIIFIIKLGFTVTYTS